MIWPETIAGLDLLRVRDMFKAFVDAETQYDWSSGVPMVILHKMTRAHVRTALGLTHAEATRVHKALVAESLIEARRLVPTHKGMALAQHLDRSRISRAEAEGIVERVLEWADRVNAKRRARVRIRSIDLYGSSERGADDVGDVDLIVEFTTDDLGDDLQPSDWKHEQKLLAELAAVSEYVSPASVIDKARMPNANYRTIYPRPPASEP